MTGPEPSEDHEVARAARALALIYQQCHWTWGNHSKPPDAVTLALRMRTMIDEGREDGIGRHWVREEGRMRIAREGNLLNLYIRVGEIPGENGFDEGEVTLL
jgi:hypothetical protein